MAKINVIPKPQQIEEREGTFSFDKKITVSGDYTDNLKLAVTNLLLPFAGKEVEFLKWGGIIDFVTANIVDEGYVLDIDEKIKISAGSEAGFYYALQTLKQLLQENPDELPKLKIDDYPRFSYRSFMLDVARYYYPVTDIKKLIDVIAMLKLNYLHLHLTEDQGWRVQIDRYPLLTEKGSKRSHTNFNNKPHEGFYTKQDIKEIVDYARQKYVKVVPEIDMPGHMVSAISCYKHLGCFDREIEVATHWGVKHDILCAGKNSTMEFVKGVLDEIFEMFPDGYVHIGGDEAVKTRWNLCPNCKKKMDKLGVDANGLQSYFMNEVASYVKENGKTAIVWNEEKPDEILSRDVIWNYYMFGKEQEEAMVSEVNAGRKMINVQSDAYYFDLPYHDVPLRRTYETEPILKGITKPENVLGVEGDLWTEYVKNMTVAVKKSFPRTFAMAETAWTNAENKDYDDFLTRLKPAEDIVREITKVKPTSVKKATPNKAKALMQKIWFEKRQITWEGIKILRENAKIEKMVKKGKKV